MPQKLFSDYMMSDFERAEKNVDPVQLCWDQIAGMRIEEICLGKGAKAIGPNLITFKFIDRDIFCNINEKSLKYIDGKLIDDLQTKLVLLLYIRSEGNGAQSRDEDPSDNDPISPLQLPNGEVFFRGLHKIPTAPLEEKFGKKPEGFLNTGMALGGKVLDKGDASFHLIALPHIKIYFILYAEDEEFPSRVTIMLSEGVNHYLPLDGIWALCNVVVKRLLEIEADR
jgi:hypothetical protein